MTASATADSLVSLAAREKRGGRLSTAAMLIGPATIFVTVGLLIPIVILFRYSLNQFVPGKLMVEALTLENYVLFFTDPYYTAAFYRTLRVAVIVTALCLLLAFPLAYKLARTQSRYKNLLIMLLVLPLFVGNAVRAAGWMTLFGNRGFLNVTLQWIGITSRADHLHVHRVRRHRRHPGGQSPLRRADAAKRARRHRPRASRTPPSTSARDRSPWCAACCCRSPCPASLRARSSASSSP